MKSFPVNSLLWSSLLVLWVFQSGTEESSLDLCQEDRQDDMLHVQTATLNDLVEKSHVKETFMCLLHPSNELNCSWSFHTLEKDAQLSVQISVCNDEVEVQSVKEESVERDGLVTLDITEAEMNSVILQFNKSSHGEWRAYTFVYAKSKIDVSPPPSHINASVKGTDLTVTWDLPRGRSYYHPHCFKYQLDLGDQNKNKIETLHKQPYKSTVDPTHTYKLRMRTRIMINCDGCSEWSSWSHAVTVAPVEEQSSHTLNPVVVVLLSLGVNLILLAVLLFLRHQRVLEFLFPPIPSPPPKYKYFLEKTDTFIFFYPADPAMPEEEITEVEDIEKTALNTS